MAHQTTLTGAGSAHPWEAHTNESSPVTHLARDVLELGELQTRLFLLDIEASSARIRNAVILAVAGGVVLWMACVVALFAAAYALVNFAGWSQAAALLLVAIVAAILGAILLVAAWRIWRRGIVTWDRSRDELTKNIKWVKSALAGHRPPRYGMAPGTHSD